MPSSNFPVHAYALRATRFRPSPVRSVWEASMAADTISFAGGNPDLSGLPLTDIAETAARLIRDQGESTLQYGDGRGLAALREELAGLMSRTDIAADPDDILVTTGSQMGLELVTAMFCDPGDTVLVETPSYSGALSIFSGFEATIEHVACDADGIIPEQLRSTLSDLRAGGRRIKLLYTIPNFNNPSGVTLSGERRRLVAEICAEAGIVVVEDDPYGLIRFEGSPAPALRAGDPNVIYLGSMSKIFSPGIRTGWVLAPREVRVRLQMLAESTTINPPTLSQHLALEYLRSGIWESHLAATVEQYRIRAMTLLHGLESIHGVLPKGSAWTRPSGGFFVWITLPPHYSAQELSNLAIEEKVVFVPGSAFFADAGGERHLRLSFSLASPDRIQVGLTRLARASSRLASGCAEDHSPGTTLTTRSARPRL